MKKIFELSLAALLLVANHGDASAAQDGNKETMMESVRHLNDFQTIELRRYVTKDGERTRFAQYFETWFPEAFEQLGAMVFGQFLDRDHPTHFSWLRGFKDINARPIVSSAFYYGPLWKEHRGKLNAALDDSDNVMLLRPLRPESGIPVLPAVDPVTDKKGAQGIVVIQIFAIRKGSENAFAEQAVAAFARYRMAAVHQAGVLVSLDVPNNFPQLPIRTDGPWLVWIGVIEDKQALDVRFEPIAKTVAQSLVATGLLREAPELLVLDPTPRSRLRWLPDATDVAISPR
ncbi:MAG: hypothetical protein ACR2GP_00045 [Burkholderiaceae bacterium]